MKVWSVSLPMWKMPARRAPCFRCAGVLPTQRERAGDSNGDHRESTKSAELQRLGRIHSGGGRRHDRRAATTSRILREADAAFGGPHQLRGIEIYKGKPIFYSMGNFIFEVDQQSPLTRDMYETFEQDPLKVSDHEFAEVYIKWGFNSEIWYQSVIAVSKYEQGQVSEIRLYPVELGFRMRGADRGVPRMASPAAAQAILERLQRLSQPLHTDIKIDHNVGIIRVPKASKADDLRAE